MSATLASIASTLETTAGASTSANANEAGYWKRIAAALETMASASTSANANINGYQLRSARAIEVLSGTSGAEENLNENGYLKRIADGLEAQTGVTTGSLIERIRIASGSYTVGPSYSTEATALFARMTNQPNTAHKTAINNLIGALKSGATSGTNIWAKLDAFYIFAAADAQAAGLNWIADAYNISLFNTPTFTADRGYTGIYTGTAATGSYLDTGFNPTSAGGHYSLNSAHIWFWSLTSAAPGINGAFGDMGVREGLLEAGAWNSTTNSGFTINSTTSGIGHNNTVNVADGLGLRLFNRSGNAAEEAYDNGAALTLNQAAKTATALPNGNIVIGCSLTGNISGRQYLGGGFGGSLNAAEQLDLYNGVQAYKTAVGA